MTLFVNRKILFSVDELAGERGRIFQRGDSGEKKFKGLSDLAEVEIVKSQVSIPVTDQDLLAGTAITTAKILYVETDTELTLKLNSAGDTGVLLKPIDENSKAVFYLEGEFSRVLISVAGTTGNANVLACMVGA